MRPLASGFLRVHHAPHVEHQNTVLRHTSQEVPRHLRGQATVRSRSGTSWPPLARPVGPTHHVKRFRDGRRSTPTSFPTIFGRYYLLRTCQPTSLPLNTACNVSSDGEDSGPVVHFPIVGLSDVVVSPGSPFRSEEVHRVVPMVGCLHTLPSLQVYSQARTRYTRFIGRIAQRNAE